MASAFLHRTMDRTADSGYAKKWVCSTWLKISNLGSVANKGLFSIQKGSTSNSRVNVGFNSSDNLWVETKDSGGTDDAFKQTKMMFRDPNAWYHIYIKYDSTESTASDRLVFYVNGVEQTYDNVNEVSSNFGILMDSSVDFRVGIYRTNGGAIRYMDGQYSHFHFINYEDGATPDPYTDFGETNASTGIWIPKTSPSVTYGDQSVFLKFDNSANMGLDSSGQSNNLTTSGTVIQTKDTPSNVHASGNVIVKGASSQTTASNIALTATSGQNSWEILSSSFAVNSGKWYAEFKMGSNQVECGIMDIDQMTTSDIYPGSVSRGFGYRNNGDVYKGGSGQSGTFASYTAGDIIGVAMDMTNNKLYLSKNGTWQNSGDPTSGSTGTGALSIDSGYNYCFVFAAYNGNISANFGNGQFGTSNIASAGSNGNGSLFEYDVPNGYYALNTKNIGTQS